jgi:DNA-binding transcriptional LysR family regulator
MKAITLHQLQIFEVAARHLSFTRAAEELYLTQPTISMQIKQLSKAVGLPLFEQVGKRLYLKRGKLYTKPARRFLNN